MWAQLDWNRYSFELYAPYRNRPQQVKVNQDFLDEVYLASWSYNTTGTASMRFCLVVVRGGARREHYFSPPMFLERLAKDLGVVCVKYIYRRNTPTRGDAPLNWPKSYRYLKLFKNDKETFSGYSPKNNKSRRGPFYFYLR